MPTRWKGMPGILFVTFGITLGLIVGTFRASAQDVATPTASDTTPSLTIATPGATPAQDAVPIAGQFPAGTILVTTTENLRLRTDFSTDAETLQTLPEGSQVQVISGPEQAEDFTWYEVEVLDSEESVSGWIASSADFVDTVEGSN